MRDILNILDTLTEASTLVPSEFKGKADRYTTFIEKIKNGEKFTTIDDQEVVLHPDEYEKYLAIWNPVTKEFISSNAEVAKLAPGSTYGGRSDIRLSKLKKTTEFGGAGLAVGADPSAGGKASFALKPKAVGIADRDIAASSLYQEIINSPHLKSSDYGKVVIDLATYIVSDEAVIIPEWARKNQKLRAAIQDDAGEYLGVLALLYGRSRFPRKEAFEKWLGSSLGELTLRFPSSETEPLADSYANIKNKKTGHTINISSKGKDGGAAPSIKTGLKMPDHIRQNPKLKNGVEFVDICIQKGTIDQAFDGIDLLYTVNKDSISERWWPLLPFSKNPELKAAIIKNIRTKGVLEKSIPKELKPLVKSIIAGVDSEDAGDGGKIVYSIKKEVADAINARNALPEFRDMVLEILEMNFVQQYTDYETQHFGEFTFATQWPAKLDGRITLENKSSAKNPTQGGFSFKLSRSDESVSSEPGQAPVDAASANAVPAEKTKKATSKNVNDIFRGGAGEEQERETQAVGRKRR